MNDDLNNKNDQNTNDNYNFDFANQVTANEPVTPVTPVEPVTPVTPVEPVTSAEQTNEQSVASEDDADEIIKDKEATKRFIIILTVVIVAFIIALPFIFKVAS